MREVSPNRADGSARSLVVWLYLAIPEAAENRRVVETPWSTGKRFGRRVLDVGGWLLRRHSITYYAWASVADTNKGDAAIRESIKEQLADAFAPRRIEFREIQWGGLNRETLRQINAAGDLFVIAGSGYFHINLKGDLPARIEADVACLSEMSCPRVAYGIGINRFSDSMASLGSPVQVSQAAERIIGRTIAQLDLVSVRDLQTAEVLERVGKQRIYLTGDPALFYPAEPPDRSTPHPASSRDRLRVGLNFALHGRQAAELQSEMLPIYAEFLRRLCNELPIELHYVQHSATEALLRFLLRLNGVKATWHDPPLRQLVPLYETLDVHISQMLHSSILCMSAGTPAMNLAYDAKTAAFFSLLENPSYCISARERDVEALLAVARSLVRDRTERRAVIRRRKSELRVVLRAFLEQLVDRMSHARVAGD